MGHEDFLVDKISHINKIDLSLFTLFNEQLTLNPPTEREPIVIFMLKAEPIQQKQNCFR